MRKLAGLVLALAVTAQSAAAQNTISGSRHDFTEPNFGIASIDTTFDIDGVTVVQIDTTMDVNQFWFWPSYAKYGVCSSCHTAHNAFSKDAPLWNHESTTATFTLYDSPTLENAITQPQSVSKVCLSCHDGTVAVNSLHNGDGTFSNRTNGFVTGAKYITGADAGYIGDDLSDDHPISVEYDPAADNATGGWAKLRDASEVTGTGLRLYGTGTPTVECGTCHEPHMPGTNGLFFRPYTNTGSWKSRCQVCHDK